MFPDQAKMYISAIEDGQYKEEKIDCKSKTHSFSMRCLTVYSLG